MANQPTHEDKLEALARQLLLRHGETTTIWNAMVAGYVYMNLLRTALWAAVDEPTEPLPESVEGLGLEDRKTLCQILDELADGRAEEGADVSPDALINYILVVYGPTVSRILSHRYPEAYERTIRKLARQREAQENSSGTNNSAGTDREDGGEAPVPEGDGER